MKKSGVPLFLCIIFLILIGVQGTIVIRDRRCSCIETYQKTIRLRFIKDLQQFAPSSLCEKTEIIATLKNGTQTCLNPDLTEVKKLMKHWEKQVSQKKEQRKGGKHQKFKTVRKFQRPHPKKTT
ncbi:PREDICTED: c-X-C motif chemokine 9 [Chrysochloris asiatica]|uniref:C-X-C motif chemokine n=1 Tax=Chrysochloris asiatica TaxID=185453 RepID=A0A9B0WY80_CHRAS|nr:PREDICTED: c-X-C motif chemokine 9 [Chrysochloris asiatica]